MQKIVDLVLVVDASGSMQNCFDQLRQHLTSLLKPLQGNIAQVNWGLVALNCSTDSLYHLKTLNDEGHAAFCRVYSSTPNGQASRTNLFSSNPDDVVDALANVDPVGDEDMLLALDIAADFPFQELSEAVRVIALFSDEPFESNHQSAQAISKIELLKQKLMARRIKLFMALPESAAAEQLAEVDGSEVEFIPNGEGMKAVNFQRLLGQMGKTISVSSLQSGSEPRFQKALFGQDKWTSDNRQGDWSAR